MKKRKLIMEVTFLVMLILLTLFLKKLDACAFDGQCSSGECFDYDQAFSLCENFCVAKGHIGCAEPWWITAYCAGSFMELCSEAFWVICQDGYSVRKNQNDFCNGCRLN